MQVFEVAACHDHRDHGHIYLRIAESERSLENSASDFSLTGAAFNVALPAEPIG